LLLLDWFVRARHDVVLLVFGAVLLVGAVLRYDSLSVPQMLATVLRYHSRSRWTLLRIEESPANTLVVHARGTARLASYELAHRGRLDLTGGDDVLALGVMNLANALAREGDGGHLSLHSWSRRQGCTTGLVVPPDSAVSEHWQARATALRESLGLVESDDSTWLLERWNYLRLRDEVMTLYRVSDFTNALSPASLLRDLQHYGETRDISLHVHVVSSTKAQRLVGRAVHQVRSDDALSTRAGYRRTARSELRHERLRQREVAVARGSALVQLAVYVGVRAASVSALRVARATLARDAQRAGLQLARGHGRQALWFCAQVPGDGSW